MAKMILVVEDESAIRELLVALIDDENYTNAVGAASGLDALKLLETVTFDLITLDMNMPLWMVTLSLKNLLSKPLLYRL